MQIVIDIPEEVLNRICFSETYPLDMVIVCNAIHKHIKLPKAHGRLVDADVVMFEHCINFDTLSICGEANCDMDCKSCDLLELYPKDVYENVVVEAYKEGANDESSD